MKPREEPCLNNYLTIHVPPSSRNSARKSKSQIEVPSFNPLMNKKIQNVQKRSKNDVAVLYSSLPNKTYKKNKKFEIIPLLGNAKGYKVFKDVQKTQYKFVFHKNKLGVFNDYQQNQFNGNATERPESTRALSKRCNLSQATRSSIFCLTNNNFKNTWNLKQKESPIKKMEMVQTLPVEGERIKFSRSHSNWRSNQKGIMSENQVKSNIQIFL